MPRSILWSYLLIAAMMTGCAQGRDAHLADTYQQQQLAKAAEQKQVWEGNKDWLLARLPQAALMAQRVTSAFKAYPGNKNLRSSEYQKSDYDKLFDFMRVEFQGYQVQRPPESAGHLVLIDGDAAYLFDMIHLGFLGVASLDKGLYFAASDVPLERSDDRSFAFVADGTTDTTTSWYLFRRNVLEQNQVGSQDLGSYSISRVELDRAGVAKQVDFLTPQQREEHELAQQGVTWRNRAEMKVVQFCSKQGARDGSKKQGGHGKRGGMGSRSAANGATAENQTDASSSPDGVVTDPQKGTAALSCRTGMGTILIDSGTTAEVSSIFRNREGNLSPTISTVSKEMAGGTMTYSYHTETAAQGSSIGNTRGREISLEFKSTNGSNKLNLNLSPEKGVTAASLDLPGDWYNFLGKEVTRSEFGDLFIRAYRDCAIKDRQDACKRMPELFISLLNASMAQDLVSYIGEHYTKPANSSGKNDSSK
jgi:hypothetical protein